MSELERRILEYVKTDDHIDFEMVYQKFAADDYRDLLNAVHFLVQQGLAKYVRQDDMLCIHCTVLGLDTLRPSPRENDTEIPF